MINGHAPRRELQPMGARPSLTSGVALSALVGLVSALSAAPAYAQGAVDVLSEEIIVTATKRAETLAQDAPLAVTAYGEEQLEALNFQSLQSLTYAMPNVQLEDIGTSPGVANFSIRGVGINSSIPSVDPTVGVFVDGMYLGINAGVLVDNFDLEAIEVLRGPQGVLFGRNVTGGAILIRTRAPTDELEVRARAAVETGPAYYFDGSISGPLAPGLLSGKLAFYRSDDEGWFENDFDGSQFGASEQTVSRGALRLTPADNLEFLLRVEHGETGGDGPAAQNHANYARDSFDFSVNNRGYTNSDWDQAILETNWDVAFGDGTITNVLGWRGYESTTSADIDSTGTSVSGGTAFHSRSVTEQSQISNELRYAGSFGSVDVTTGLYYFSQDLLYVEERFLFSGVFIAGAPFFITRVGGGKGEFSTFGAFMNNDWHLTDTLTLNFGLRYTHEEKDAGVSRIRRAADNLDPSLEPADPVGDGVLGGGIDARSLNYSDSPFNLSWDDTSPRIGLQWEPTPDTNIYAFWAKGFRSGGVNFRVTTLGTTTSAQPPVSFDSEEQTSYEIGIKQDFAGGRARINFAVFNNQIEGMQRETNFPGSSGVQQVIVNAGDATIRGAELEARFSLTDKLLIALQAGYTDGEYDSVTADLNGDLLVNAADAALEIPRLAPWSYGLNIIHDLNVGSWGVLSSRVGFSHRDANFYTDSNVGVLNEVDFVDANFSFRPNEGNWTFAVYGNNLTDEASFGGDTQLPDNAAFGGDGAAGPKPPPTFSPLNKGRVIGAELRLEF